jgi:hypothetical protein
MSRFEEFLPQVMPYVPGCPEIVAVSAIRSATIEFCRKSLWLLYEHDPFVTEANQGSYGLDLPEDTDLVMVFQATYNGLPLAFVGEVNMAYLNDNAGLPKCVTQIDPTSVQLVPIPQADGDTVKLLVAITPTESSVTCDDALLGRWAERIGYGARARLHAIPGQTFSSPETALQYRAMFVTAIGEARIERARGMTRAVSRVRPPRFI